MKSHASYIQEALTFYKNHYPLPDDQKDPYPAAQLALNSLTLERRANLTGFREALLSLKMAHRENIENGYTPAIIGWIQERITSMEGK